MRFWQGKTKDGYAFIRLKGETREQNDLLALLHPGPGFRLAIEHKDEHNGCHEIRVEPDPRPQKHGDDESARKAVAYDRMSDDDLRTLCAERGLRPAARDKRGDLIVKLQKADAA
jgi:hypothetical protein